MNAIIKDNVPYCPVCEDMVLGRLTGEYSLVEYQGEKYVKFQRFCNGKCMKKYNYYCNITMEENKRYIFEGAKEVKDENAKDDKANERD